MVLLLSVGFAKGTTNSSIPPSTVNSCCKGHQLPRSTSNCQRLPQRPPSAFTDAGKHYCAAIIKSPKTSTNPTYLGYIYQGSAQVGELRAIIHALLYCQNSPVNLFSNSAYMVHTATNIGYSTLRVKDTPLDQSLQLLKDILENHKQPWYIQHLRSHTGLPGPLSLGNAEADKLVLTLQPIEEARLLHTKFHMSASSLHKLFPHLPLAQCKHLIRACRSCGPLLPLGPLQPRGANPQGLQPNAIWQEDVTHVPAFGKSKYVHTVIDTCSGATFAQAQTGEKAKQHCHLQGCLSHPWIPVGGKTDNGPCYTSILFQDFLKSHDIKHTMGIPYNPRFRQLLKDYTENSRPN